jgi:phenylalanyl-tRNA synthetase alpha chain
MSDTARTPLHPIEKKVLSGLGDGGPLDFNSLVASTGLLPDQVRRSISWLSSKGLVDVQEASTFTLNASEAPPPELLLVSKLEENKGSLPMAEMKAHFKSNQEFSAALGRASSAGWISMVPQQQSGPVITLKDAEGAKKLRGLLSELAGGGLDESKAGPELRALSADLLKRGLLTRRVARVTSMTITQQGLDALASAETGSYVEKLTPELLASVRSSGAIVRLRPIDVKAPAASFFPGRRHPVKEFINEVREVYLSMGFAEIAGDSIQSSLWNFDALFTPQDHPARELQDTFYIRGGRDQDLQRTGVVARVASVHENGWETGSKGWRYSWDIEEARRLVLRTHTTALTVRATMDSADEETRVFTIGRVYRNENLDFKHLAELTQMEGIVIGEGLNLRHLMGLLTRFYGKLGMSRVKLWPSYFPYTEPAMQVMIYYEKVGKWLEMGGSGIFRPEVTRPLGIRKPVLAWGLGLERLLMLRLGIQDIRELYNSDIEWLRRRREIASSSDIL